MRNETLYQSEYPAVK